MSIPPWNPTARKVRDRLSESGATSTAREIVERWSAAGHQNVAAWIERIEDMHQRQPIYAVRTNLVGGLPPVEVDG